MMIPYYDIDAILADAQRVPAKVNLEIPHQGALDSRPGEALGLNTTLPIPFALAEALATNPQLQPHDPVSLLTPPFLGPRVLNALSASPLAVSLRGQNPYYFAMAERFLGFGLDEDVGEDEDEEEENLAATQTQSQERGLGKDLDRRVNRARRRELRTARALVESFVMRAGVVGDVARGTEIEGRKTAGGGQPGGDELLPGLEEGERKLFKGVHERGKEVRRWMTGRSGKD